MAAGTFLNRVSGKTKQFFAAVTSAANSLVSTDATGRIDISMMPVGVSAEVTVCLAFENLTSGQFVNLFLSGGVIKAQLANATDDTKPADGFVLANVTAPASATVYRLGATNTALSGMTIGSDYYLSTTPGAVLISPGAVATGNLNQRLGKADTATEFLFDGSPSAAVTIG